MLSFRPGTDIVVRAILITAVLLNGLTPGLAFAKPSNLQSAEPAATPTETVTETATEEPTVTPIESPTPTVTETAVPTNETSTPIATDTSPETSTPPATETVTPAVTSETPILSLSSDPGFINPAGVLTLLWVIEGISSDGLTLQIILPEGFSPQGSYNGTYDDISHTLTLTLASLMGEVQLRTNIPGADAVIQAHLLNNNELIASADLFLPAHEQFVLNQEGGEIIALNGKVKVHFPKDALPEKAVIEIGTPAGDATPPYSLLGMPFEIKAHGKESGQELKQFSKQLSIFVSYADLDIQPGLERSLYLYWYNEQTGDWEALASNVDSETKTLHAFTDHFTVFDINANNWQANHLPTVDAFQVSTFTGAATYSFPIEVPSGPGGFQPSISLNYNSQIVDQSTVETQASWVGMGWALEMGSIERNTNGTPDQNIDDSYMLNVGGISTYIVQDSTEVYHTADENFWKVQYNSGTDTWQLWDKEGNQYFFEKRSRYPYTPVDCDSHNLTYLWSLTKQKNIFGQEIIYSYATETKNLKYWTTSTCSAWSMVAYETAIYPYTITYAGGKYRIRFERDLRTDYTSSWYTDVAFHNYQRYRLEDIFVEQDHNSDGIYEIIRRYDLAYAANTDPDIIFPGVTWSAGGKTLTLRSVRQYGAGGTNSLPPVTFTYDNLHLTAATNGYGGKVQFQYEEKPYYFPDGRYSYTRYDRVGLPATKRPGTAAVYWPAGSCYGGGTSWKAKSYPYDIVECDEDDGLLIQGTAYSTWFGARELFRPGGVYKFSTSIWTQNASLTPRLFDGSSEKAEENGVILLPKTASQFEVRVKTSNNQIVSVASVKMQLLTSVYRVTSKRVFDGSTVDGQENVYQYTYTYENPAVNDVAHSASVCPNPPQENCNEYIEMFSEFRGHSQVTETGPDGVITTTLFYQDDILKGRPISVTASAGATNISRVDYAYGNIPFPYIPPHPVWCTLCPAYIGLYRNWVFTDYEKVTLYGDTTTYTRVDYVYDTSSTSNYSYGNLIEKKDQTSPDGVNNWSDYRKWIYYYWPKNTTTQYLVGLPGKEKVFDALGNTLGITIYLYDGNTGDHGVAPSQGKLTTVRRLAQNGVDYSQVSYTYDSYGNRNSTSVYSGYASWSANPTTGSTYTTYTCYGGGYTLGGVECANVGTYAFPLWTLNPLGHQTSWTYDYSKGVPLTETDPNGITTSAQYDPLGRITKLIRPGDDSVNPTIEIQYFDPNLHATGLIKDPYTVNLTQRIQGSQRYLISRKYDGMGRQIWITSGSASGVDQTYVQTIYPVRNQSVTTGPMETRQSQPYFSGELPQYTITTIDPAAHTTTLRLPDGSTTVTDTYGLVTTVTDASGNQTKTEKDVWGRVVSILPPTGPAVGYVYDAKDNLVKAIRAPLNEVQVCLNNPNQQNCPTTKTVSLTYDLVGRKISMSDPDMGNWSYTYNGLGNLISQTDARSCTLSLGYDALNRLTSKNSSGTGCGVQVSASYTYDSGTNGKGHRTGMSDSSGWTTWTYDARGRLAGETKTITGFSYTTNWTYNSADLPISMAYPDGEVVKSTYDARMLLDKLYVDGGYTYVDSTKYDASRRIDVRTYGNTIRTDYDYYDYNTQGGRLRTIKSGTTLDSTSLQSLEYAYDAVGNIDWVKDWKKSNPQLQDFSYDALDRLTSAVTTGGTVGLYSESYEYNSVTGNLTTKAGMTLTYGASNHAHAVSSAGNNTYIYDANGSMTRRTPVGESAYHFTYDAENRLVEVKRGTAVIASFLYDSDGKRVQSVVNGTTTLFYGAFEIENPGTSETLPPAFYDVPAGYWAKSQIEGLYNLGILSACATNPLRYCPTSTLTRIDGIRDILRAEHGSGYVPPAPSHYFADMVGHPLEAWADQAYREGITGGCSSNPRNFCPTSVLTRAEIVIFLLRAKHGPGYAPPAASHYFADMNGHWAEAWADQAYREGITSGCSSNPRNFCPTGTVARDMNAVLIENTFHKIPAPAPFSYYGTWTKYYFAGSTRVAQRICAGNAGGICAPTFFLTDHLGSTSMSVAMNGDKTSEILYKPWGEVRYASTDSASLPTQYTYTGQFSYMDDLTTTGVTEGFGLMFYNARWYDPYLNHFTQPDSIVPDPGDPQSWDRYAYTLNNPLRYTDPTGHDVNCSIGNNCKDARDLTSWTVAVAVDIAESAEMQAIANINAARGLGVGSTIISMEIAWPQFYSLVANGKKYDVKDKVLLTVGNPIELGNNWYEYSTVGNILYGFYGLAAGFSKAELHAGAGVAQLRDHFLDEDQPDIGGLLTLFDTEDDYYAVQFGFFLYENYYNDGDLTESEFLEALSKYEYADKLALRPEPKDFRPRRREYEIDEFYQ